MSMTYDCHGKTHSEVKADFENWILMNQYKLPIEVITGNSEHMKRIIKSILEFYDFTYSESITNSGIIKIY